MNAKKTAWNYFAKYIKLRDALETTGTSEYCKCITCGEVKPISEIDAGHMISGRTSGILFDESIVHGQCVKCNRQGGEPEKYKQVMIQEHGKTWYEKKYFARKTAVRVSETEYEQIAREYREKYNKLRNKNEVL